jgi:hypothetical protein
MRVVQYLMTLRPACGFELQHPLLFSIVSFERQQLFQELLAIFILHSHIPAYYVSLTDVISDRAIIVSFWPPAKELCSSSSHVTLSKLLTEWTALLRIVFEMCCMCNVTSLTQNFPFCFIHYTVITLSVCVVKYIFFGFRTTFVRSFFQKG